MPIRGITAHDKRGHGTQGCWQNAMNYRQVVSGWFRRFFPEKTLGQRGEAAAARYLRRLGYKIVARSDRFGPGEPDLVALDRDTIVFVEVKTRRTDEAGHPAEAVDQTKQQN